MLVHCYGLYFIVMCFLVFFNNIPSVDYLFITLIISISFIFMIYKSKTYIREIFKYGNVEHE